MDKQKELLTAEEALDKTMGIIKERDRKKIAKQWDGIMTTIKDSVEDGKLETSVHGEVMHIVNKEALEELGYKVVAVGFDGNKTGWYNIRWGK